MNGNRKDRLLRVEKALLAARRSGDAPEIGEHFARETMRRVRQVGRHPLGEAANNGSEPRLVWSFAAASCAVAFALVLYLSSMDLSALHLQVAQSLVDDSTEFILVESFAVI